MRKLVFVFSVVLFHEISCDNKSPETMGNDKEQFADVTEVTASGRSGSYQFSVTIKSPDTGCDQYADWWEVISEEGDLIYRRILLHSHVSEQPFRRSGGPVQINSKDMVFIRAHMNNKGYGGTAFRGTPESGFNEFNLSDDFASELEKQAPLPDGCAG